MAAVKHLVLLLLLPACFLSKTIEKPQVTVTGVALGSVSLAGVDGTIDLDVFNPNTFGVPLSLIEWELSVGSASAVAGRIELSQTIPAKDIAPVVASLHIDTMSAVGVGSELAAGVRDYTLAARFTFTTTFGSVAVDVVHTGQLL